MSSRRLLTSLVAAGALASLLAGCTDQGDESPPAAADPSAPGAAQECEDGEPVTRTLDNGASWSMCWSVDPKLGLVLRDVRFTPTGADPIPILASLSVAQLEVPYDDGGRSTSDITEAGFGGTKMKTLTDTECAGERLETAVPNIGDGTFGEAPVREVLCSETVDTGVGYRSSDGGTLVADRSSAWQLSSISKVGWYEYIAQYSFGSDGSIRPALGATGDISPVDFTDPEHGWPVGEGDEAHAASHSHNVVWRAHWDLGAGGELAAEQYDAEPTGEMGSESPVLEGALTRLPRPTTAEWTDRRWWRVLAPDVLNDDGHPVSYEIDLGKTDSFEFTHDHHEHGDDAGYDVAFTNADECQVFATHNDGQCGSGVLDYVDRGKGDDLGDVVSWVAVGFHHVVRDEDQSPMDTHWQGFTLLPRDLTAQRVAVPPEREELNGVPSNEWTEEYEELLDD
ncbi:copper amine oxidase [Isoptericola sp. BMS4]|uniref:copper amine oxidase n=1 Tax=Isoptericola sp. BMS4 TaxID=2527875 RepID=UPI00141D9C58|nr:copper amine oxidase [Isoptericola sp. BMS4]